MTQYFATTPLFIIGAGMIMLVLLGLTMRSIIRRERAMIDAAADDPRRIAAYEQRWRSAA